MFEVSQLTGRWLADPGARALRLQSAPGPPRVVWGRLYLYKNFGYFYSRNLYGGEYEEVIQEVRQHWAVIVVNA